MSASAGGSAATKQSRKASGGTSIARKAAAAGNKGAGAASSAGSMKSASGASGAKGSRRQAGKPRQITPEEALENTRNLLAEKQSRARQAPAWQAHDAHSSGHVPDAGFESAGARDRAADLHEGEMRLNANKGSISAQDRHHQGKRDNR